MGKRQHQKDKMYLTYTEWTTLYGGKKAASSSNSSDIEAFKRLPFDHCCLCLQPFEVPYCDLDGNIFDLSALIPFMKKFKLNPVNGKPLDFKSLIQLNFAKNAEDEFHCPVLFKVFTKNSHIAAIKTTGNVFSMEAIEQLNIKNKNWKDLINDEPFERKDIIILQDPQNLHKFNISTFHHIKNNLRVETEEEIAERGNPQARLKTMNPETKSTLEELEKEYKESDIALNPVKSNEKADKFNAAHYSTGAVAAGFTSTVMEPVLMHESAIVHEDLVRYERVKKKGYVRLLTNLGPLNIELHCDIVPKTCENFLKHCESGYYNGTKFFRSIRNFMIQGGDPTNTGRGGESIWKKPFNDEFKSNLLHSGRGIVSMANSGKNTNGSQFFITYRTCKTLDHKHTVFGKVVGGMETLSEMERIEVDNKDKPIEDIILLRAQVFVDPYEEADEQLTKERQEELAKEREEKAKLQRKKQAQKELKVFKTGIGKYINPATMKSSNTNTKEEQEEGKDKEKELSQAVPPPQKKKKTTEYKFNFNNW